MCGARAGGRAAARLLLGCCLAAARLLISLAHLIIPSFHHLIIQSSIIPSSHHIITPVRQPGYPCLVCLTYLSSLLRPSGILQSLPPQGGWRPLVKEPAHLCARSQVPVAHARPRRPRGAVCGTCCARWCGCSAASQGTASPPWSMRTFLRWSTQQGGRHLYDCSKVINNICI